MLSPAGCRHRRYLCMAPGSGSVVFGNGPDRSCDARIINQIDISKILRGRGLGSFAVPSQCQPYKCLYPPAEDITLTASGMTIHNLGTVPAWPKFTLYGSGTITMIPYSGAVQLSGISNGIALDWDNGKTGSDTELADFITLAAFRKALSFAIIGMGKQSNNSFLWSDAS